MEAFTSAGIEQLDGRVLATPAVSAKLRREAHAAMIIRPSLHVGPHSTVLMRLLSVLLLTTWSRFTQYSDPGSTVIWKKSSTDDSFSRGCLLGESERLTVPRSAG